MWWNIKKLNEVDLTMVKSIFIQMYADKDYASYRVVMEENDVAGSCSISIMEPVSSKILQKNIFFPDSNGVLDSIAIYGVHLDIQLQAINASKKCFGFDVIEVSLETQNTESPFVDVKLKSNG